MVAGRDPPSSSSIRAIGGSGPDRQLFPGPVDEPSGRTELPRRYFIFHENRKIRRLKKLPIEHSFPPHRHIARLASGGHRSDRNSSPVTPGRRPLRRKPCNCAEPSCCWRSYWSLPCRPHKPIHRRCSPYESLGRKPGPSPMSCSARWKTSKLDYCLFHRSKPRLNPRPFEPRGHPCRRAPVPLKVRSSRIALVLPFGLVGSNTLTTKQQREPWCKPRESVPWRILLAGCRRYNHHAQAVVKIRLFSKCNSRLVAVGNARPNSGC